MTYHKKGEESFLMDQLLDREKWYIRFVADIVHKLTIVNSAMGNPLEGNGIILIDEMELHLYSKW